MFNNKRKGQGYIEIMVVVAVLLIITLFAIPRYQDLRRDAFRAQVASDSRLVETYVMEELVYNDEMPINSSLLSDNELKDLVDGSRSYLMGDILKSEDIDTLGGEKYKLDKDEVLKHVNTKLKGDFVYTDSGVIYINNVAASKGQEQNNQEQNNIDVEDLEKMIGPVKQVALGFFHSAAVTENGDLYTWGRNDEGQLGLGDTRDRSRPTKVDGLSNVKQVSLGNYHSAALTKDGSIYTWGSNWSGQLGLSDTSDKSRPTKVDSLSDVKQVVLGYSHSAALTEDGDLYTWGYNQYGQLGRTGDDNIPTKVSFPNNAKIKNVALGSYYSAAITEDGSLYTWGDNRDSQLGLGDNNIKSIDKPTKVYFSNNTKVKQIAIGTDHSAALTENGDLYTWGDNSYGQLGLGLEDNQSKNTPTKVDLENDIKVNNLASGSFHSGFLTSEGELYIWGSENGGITNKGLQSKPTKVNDLPKLKQIDLSIYHSAAITEDGSLYTWGSNWCGQLGLDNKDNEVFEPTKVEFFNKK